MMKKVIFTGMFTIFSMSLFAQSNKDALPSRAQDFIGQHFSSTTVQAVQKESGWQFWDNDDMYEVRLSNGIKLDFNKKGEITEIDSNAKTLPGEALPKEIRSYVQSNYPNVKIESWSKDGNEQEVELSDDTDLVFNQNGEFLKWD